MTDDRKHKTGGEDYQLDLVEKALRMAGQKAMADAVSAADRALAESRAEVERLRTAGKRVTAAFRAHGEATPFTREIDRTRHECESAILALDDALNLEPTP